MVSRIWRLAVSGALITGILLVVGAAPAAAAGTCSSTTPQYCPAPAVVTGAVAQITYHSVTLTGTVNANGAPTTCLFGYGLSTTYTSTTPAASVGSGTTAVSFTASVVGLAPSALFHYALVCSSAGGLGLGTDMTFTTSDHGPSRVAFSGATAFVATNRVGGIFLGCYGDRRCVGRLTLKSGGKTIATSSYAIAPNSGLIVHFSISKSTFKTIQKKTKISVAASAVDSNGPRAAATVSLHIFK